MSMRLEIFQSGDRFTLSAVDKRGGRDVVVNLTTQEIRRLRDLLTNVLRDTGIEWDFSPG